ncbi:MAG: hypothetical protein RLZZ211_1174 [Bacteroidota bacterium]|jgi:hypothetical protein
MKNSYLLLFFLIKIPIFSQYCTNVGPTSTIDSNVESVVLNGVVGSINYVGCPGVVGLQDLTQSVNVSLNAGANYIISIKFGTCGNNYAGAGEAWIDFDQNGNFDSYESLGTWVGMPPAPIQNWSFTVPANAVNGLTRMRVMQREQGTIPLNPCGTFQWGSVTDFGITLTNGLDCTGYPGDDHNDAIIVSALPYTDTRSTEVCYSNQNYVYPSPDIYYSFEPNPLLAEVHVSLCGANFDTFLSVVDLNGNVIAYNDDAPDCAPQSSLSFDATDLGPLYIIVEGWGALSGDYTLQISASYVGLETFETAVFNAYPNPSQGLLNLTSNSGIYQFLDINGQLLQTFDTQTQAIFNLENLAAGVYLLKEMESGRIQKWQKL